MTTRPCLTCVEAEAVMAGLARRSRRERVALACRIGTILQRRPGLSDEALAALLDVPVLDVWRARYAK